MSIIRTAIVSPLVAAMPELLHFATHRAQELVGPLEGAPCGGALAPVADGHLGSWDVVRSGVRDSTVGLSTAAQKPAARAWQVRIQSRRWGEMLGA